MNRAFAKILLFAYVCLLLRPYLPFAMDFLAHTFWYTQHMATVHYENGKFHVHYEYLEAARKSAPEKTAHNIRELVAVGDHLSSPLRFDFMTLPAQPVAYSLFTFYLPNVFPSGEYPPPKA